MADTTDQASSLHHDHKPSNLHTDYEQTCKALAVLTKEVFKSTFTSSKIKCLLSEIGKLVGLGPLDHEG